MEPRNQPQDIQNLDHIRLWIAHTDAQQGERWEQQWKTNNRLDKRVSEAINTLERIRDRIDSLERRIAWLAGMAAALGAVGGSLLSSVISGGS